MGNPYLNSGLRPKTHYDSENTGSTFQLPAAHQFGPRGSASVTNLTLPVGNIIPGVMVHANGYVYVHIQDTSGQFRLYKKTKDLDPGPGTNEQTYPATRSGYHLIDVDGFIYIAGGNAIYKFDPDTLLVTATNPSPGPAPLSFLNILYDGRLVAADTNANLYVYERDFDTNSAHLDPIAQYTEINETNDNTIAVDDLNKIYVITRQHVWAIQWTNPSTPMTCLWKYTYSGSSSGSSVTVAGDRVIFADKPRFAPFHYVAIPKNQSTNCQTPSGLCLQQAAAAGTVDPRNSFNYGGDIAIVLGTGSLNGQVRRFPVSSCSPAQWAHDVNNAWPTPLLTPDRVYVYYRDGNDRRMTALYLDTGNEDWNTLVGSGSDYEAFTTIIKGEETRIYVGTGAGVSMLK